VAPVPRGAQRIEVVATRAEREPLAGHVRQRIQAREVAEVGCRRAEREGSGRVEAYPNQLGALVHQPGQVARAVVVDQAQVREALLGLDHGVRCVAHVDGGLQQPRHVAGVGLAAEIGLERHLITRNGRDDRLLLVRAVVELEDGPG
jgi:hypothetical protein